MDGSSDGRCDGMNDVTGVGSLVGNDEGGAE